MSDLSRDDIVSSLRKFKSRRDSLLHEDVSTFRHHLDRFLQLCSEDHLVRRVLDPVEDQTDVDIDAWWEKYTSSNGDANFPSDEDEEILTRLRLLEKMQQDRQVIPQFGILHSGGKQKKNIELVRSLIVRPLVEELGHSNRQ